MNLPLLTSFLLGLVNSSQAGVALSKSFDEFTSGIAEIEKEFKEFEDFEKELRELEGDYSDIMQSDAGVQSDFNVFAEEVDPDLSTCSSDRMIDKESTLLTGGKELDYWSKRNKEVCELETKLTDIKKKITDFAPHKRKLRDKITSLRGKYKDKKNCDENCKKEIEDLRVTYSHYKYKMEDYKGKKDRFMSELEKYHKKYSTETTIRNR